MKKFEEFNYNKKSYNDYAKNLYKFRQDLNKVKGTLDEYDKYLKQISVSKALSPKEDDTANYLDNILKELNNSNFFQDLLEEFDIIKK